MDLLDEDQVVSLYKYVRDNSIEEEWRDEFIEAFPDREHLLPEPLL